MKTLRKLVDIILSTFAFRRPEPLRLTSSYRSDDWAEAANDFSNAAADFSAAYVAVTRDNPIEDSPVSVSIDASS